MSDDNFIARWSRLKREAESEKRRAEGQQPGEAQDQPPTAAAGQAATSRGEARAATEAPFDPETLPPIGSIVAGTDVRAFLQKGVPAELTKAALRRAWATDPAIRDFIGLAENQWDFTDPAAIPGFGPLEASGEIQQLVAQATGRMSEAPDAVGLAKEEPPRATEEADQSPHRVGGNSTSSQPGSAVDQENSASAASHHPEPNADGGTARRRKGHGAALPRQRP